MRATIRLPDQLYADVKKLAQEEGTTVTSVIEDALRVALDRRHGGSDQPFVIKPYRPRIPGTLPGVDLDNSAALQDLTDGIE